MRKLLADRRYWGGFFLLLLLACSPEEQEEDVLLAQVFNRRLHLSELEGMIPPGTEATDSTLRLNAFIERWVRESLLMHEAEKNIPKDLNIDELVRDYRASLIRHNYEKLIVELQLDSTIRRTELAEYYETHKSQYVLQEPLLRCHLVKIPQERLAGGEAQRLQELWRNGSQGEENLTALTNYCQQNASVYLLQDSAWYEVSKVLEQLPSGWVGVGNFREGREFSHTAEGHRYLLRINELVAKNEIAPMAYVADQATKVILHQRKIKLLEDKKEEIYDRELRRNNIQIFNQ
ncbi:MAG: hypothetical protein AAFW73_01685 [Bacteroidota bacterium]